MASPPNGTALERRPPAVAPVRPIPVEPSPRPDFDLRALVSHNESVAASATIGSVFDVLRHTSLEFLGVLDGDRLLGMCSRHAIDSLLGGRYGFALWARKPIAQHLLPNEIRITVTTAITDVLKEVFGRDSERFYHDVLLVDEAGRFLGLISTETLFKVQNALLLANIGELEKKEGEIRQKNEQMKADLHMAMELQQAMMPRTETFSSPEEGPRFEHRYIGASLVGGDFFHVVRLSDTAASVFICDVMGHGVRSALITAMLRALIESCGPDAADPSLLMTHLNSEFTKILRQTGTVLFATAFYCVLDSANGELRFARAGHPYPFHVSRRSGLVSPLSCNNGSAGPALGLIDTARYGNSSMPLEPGDWLLLFTDGIEEATNDDGLEFGRAGLAGVLEATAHLSPGKVLDELLHAVADFTHHTPFADDVCLVAAALPAPPTNV